MKILENKVCLITGANRGIGAQILETFAAEGAEVYAHARVEGSMDDKCEELRKKYGIKAIPLYFDLTNSHEIKKAAKTIKEKSSRVDVLVNNAGIVSIELIGMINLDQMRKMFDVNVFGLVELTQLIASKFMLKQKSGSIINISSIVGVEGSRGQTAYSASKGAVIAITKSAAKELAPYQIRVNSVAPGMTATDRVKVSCKKNMTAEFETVGMGRLASREDIANACLYFASDMSNYVTGQIMTVSGGYDTTSRNIFDIKYI